MMNSPQIAQRAFNTPLLVQPAKAMAFLAGMGTRIAGRDVRVENFTIEPDAVAQAALPARAGVLVNDIAERVQRNGRRPYLVKDGIAVIEVIGTLVHRGSYIGSSSGVTSYEGLGAQVKAAVLDPSIRGIALEIDSFGGEVAGAFDLADTIRAARATKPVYAFIADHAFSAGYAIASQADRIIVPRTGAVGSIGVVVMHLDMSRRLDGDGVAVSLIHAGSHKVDGNPYEPLPPEVRNDIQIEIDAVRELFIETVSLGRGSRLNADAARATEADSYRGATAVAAGLADEVSDLSSAFERFASNVNGRSASPMSATAGRANRSRKFEVQTMDANIQTTISVDDDQMPVTRETADEPSSMPVPDPVPEPAEAAVAAPPTVVASSDTDAAAQVRRDSAEIAVIAAQAARLGVNIDVAAAITAGTSPSVLRSTVLENAAANSDAHDLVVATPSRQQPSNADSPIIAAAKRAAARAVAKA
jgi:signal peptide peptidase SppA